MLFLVISTLMVILNAIAIMTILLNVRPSKMSFGRRIYFFTGVAAILLIQFLMVTLPDVKTYAKFYLPIAQLPTLIFFCTVAKQGIIKPIFVMLTTIFLSSPGMTISKISYGFLHLPHIVTLIVVLAVDVATLFFIWKYMKPSFDYILNVFDNMDLLGFCSVPLLYNLMILVTGGYLISEQNMIFRALIFLSTVAAFFLLMNVFRRAKLMNDMMCEKNMMAIQIATAKQTMAELYRTTEQAAIYRHDMRHHLSLIGGFAEQGELDKIKDYLSRTEQELNKITPKRYCENETINLVLSAFAEKAKKEAVALSVRADLPSALNIPDPEICSVLSNGLENALKAVVEVKDKLLKKIYVDCHIDRNMLLIMIENAYEGTLQIKDGVPITHTNGHGFGCRSMLSIAENRKGFCTFKASDGIFTLRVILPMDKELFI